MSYKIYALRYTCISWTHETQTTIIHKTTLKYLLIFFLSVQYVWSLITVKLQEVE